LPAKDITAEEITVVEWDQAELAAYLSELGGQAELAVHGARDPDAAHGALHMAAGAICDIRHPDEPGDPLPNYCEARMDQGLPVLALRIKDHGRRYAEQIVALIVDELAAAGVARPPGTGEAMLEVAAS
jgi:hypothetical protein